MPDCSTCGARATGAWTRRASDAEAEAHWDAREAFRRCGRHPEPGYVQDRTGDVTVPVYGCAHHQMPDDLAGLLHAADCPGPAGCACTTQTTGTAP